MYVTFDAETEVYVVDNCANVHIWNDFEGFIPDSYMKINSEASASVSAVNGDNNLPAGCGDVPLEWTDDEGKKYKIILKMFSIFPKVQLKF